MAHPILLGNRAAIERAASQMNASLDDIEIEDPASSPRRDAYAHFMWSKRQRKGMSLEEARRRLYNGNYFGSCMAARANAEPLLSASNMHYRRPIDPPLESIAPPPKHGPGAGSSSPASESPA